MLAGLNHESTEEVGGDLAIDLEVTSNRPDCLAHLGVAREIGVLFDRPVCVPDPEPPTGGAAGRDPGDGPDRGPRALPAVHRPGRLRGQGRREPLVDAEAAGDPGRPADQQRRRRDQLRHVRVRPAAPRLRPGQGRRPDPDPPAGPQGGDPQGDQRQGLRADAGHAGDRRRFEARRPGRRDGRARHRDRPRDDRRPDRGRPVRPVERPEDLAGARPAQRLELPLRAADRPRGHRMGQPPLRRADPRDGRRDAASRDDRRRRRLGRAGRSSRSGSSRSPGSWGSRSTRPRSRGSCWPWA